MPRRDLGGRVSRNGAAARVVALPVHRFLQCGCRSERCAIQGHQPLPPESFGHVSRPLHRRSIASTSVSTLGYAHSRSTFRISTSTASRASRRRSASDQEREKMSTSS